MVDSRTISKSEMVLLAAYDTWPEGEFTSEELVVACWEKYPDSFGLQGYSSQYPDANIVYRHIMGKSSIVKKHRWLSQKSQKLYALTPAGINHVLKIRGVDSQKAEKQKHRVDRFYEQILLRVLTGSAWNKLKNNQVGDLTFTDACGFWSINPRSSGEQYKAARRDLAVAVSTVKQYLDGNDKEITLAARVPVSLKDLDDLSMLEKEIDNKFKAQLDLISSRSIKWGKIT
ncbi:MAG: hypothetical protein Q7J73_08430 [Dehalococcoidales bacterium]|nr:hypothetical protein [Dehalococcoidales bacterium]